MLETKVMAQMRATETAVNMRDNSFLIGESLYLRGLELGDAKQAMGWRPSPFPVSPEQAEEQLKKQVPDAAQRGEVRLVACRRDNGAAVGSALLELLQSTERLCAAFVGPGAWIER